MGGGVTDKTESLGLVGVIVVVVTTATVAAAAVVVAELIIIVVLFVPAHAATANVGIVVITPTVAAYIIIVIPVLIAHVSPLLLVHELLRLGDMVALLDLGLCRLTVRVHLVCHFFVGFELCVDDSLLCA